MLLIKNATVYTMEAEGVLQNADILCEDGKIRAIGRNLTAEGAEVIDASGLIATPGLIDAHTHAGGFAGDNQDLNESTNPVTAELDAIHGIDIYADDFQEIHTRGVTACCFIPGSANVICGTGFVAKTGDPESRRHEVRHGRKPEKLLWEAGPCAQDPYGRRKHFPRNAPQGADLPR